MSWSLWTFLLVGGAGVLLFLVAIGSLLINGDDRRRFLPWLALVTGLGLMGLAGFEAYRVVYGPPGGGDIIIENGGEGDAEDPIPELALDRLRQDWDSEAAARWPVAETLADISHVAYSPPVTAERELHDRGFTDITTVVDSSMIGYVMSAEDVTVICFRGTNFTEASDWLRNLELFAARTDHGSIHRGFYHAYLALEPQIEEILEDRDTTHLWVTGHSLGGALALVCAYDMLSKQRNVDGVMTFGQPLVAHADLADHLNRELAGKYARFVNGSDLVARVPPGHAPCGSLVWFTPDGVVRSVPRPRSAPPTPPAPQPTPLSLPSSRSLSADADVDPTGKTRSFHLAPLAPSTEPLPMSEDEFQLLQTQLRIQDLELNRDLGLRARTFDDSPLDEPNVKSYADPGIEPRSSSPLFADHSMTLYLGKVRELLGVTPSP